MKITMSLHSNLAFRYLQCIQSLMTIIMCLYFLLIWPILEGRAEILKDILLDTKISIWDYLIFSNAILDTFLNDTYSISKCPVGWGKYITNTSKSLHNQHQIYEILDEILINRKGFVCSLQRSPEDTSTWNSKVWKIGN